MLKNFCRTAIALILVTSAVAATSAFAFTGFTGDVEADFDTVSGSEYIADPNGIDVGLPPGITSTGNELLGLAWHYDPDVENGTLFIGFNIFGIAGDVDGDGDPNGTSPELLALGGFDFAHSATAEAFALSLDVTGDGVYDIIAGVAPSDIWGGFQVVEFNGSPYAPVFAFGNPIAGITGELYNYEGDGEPSAARPDIEFAIHGLKSQGIYDTSNLGDFQAFIGSFADAGIGEDYIIAAFHVPEPGHLMLAGSGIVFLIGIARRRFTAKRKNG